MKIQVSLLALLLSISLFGQDENGYSKATSSSLSGMVTGETFAVVVGISDYQDEDIPDLQYADKDALAFAGYLQSPAGGSLDKDHLKVLINEQATQAQFSAALDWLWDVVKENDKVIIYFSGHGDVERKSFSQPGYLLCWDVRSVYRGGGAYDLNWLQDVISTLSIQNKANVVLIADACRAGKLSGSQVGGTEITSQYLATQWKSEIKILSCQPEEYSVEGKQWGGGRGAFSYHLLNGLYGLADKDNDQAVTVREIERYLEDHVTPEVAPQDQLPLVIGDIRKTLAVVDPDILAKLTEDKQSEMPLFSAVESRGIEEITLEKADSSVVEIYHAFKKALKEKQFLFAKEGRQENDYADYYYKKLIAEPALEPLHSSMRRNYAAALQDDAQQMMNIWMKSKEEQLTEAESEFANGRLTQKIFKEKVKSFPNCLKRAAELLGEGHYMYPTLKAREYFFEGFITAKTNRNPNQIVGEKALTAFRRSLKWQPEQPQVYLEMGLVYGNNLLQLDSVVYYINKAIELQPSWLGSYTSFSFLICTRYKQYELAKSYLEQAMKIDSNSAPLIATWALLFKQKHEYKQAEHYYKKAIQLDSTAFSTYTNLGLLYYITGRYEEAESLLKKAIQLDSTVGDTYANLGLLYSKTGRYEESEHYYKKAIQFDSNKPKFYNGLALLYSETGRYEESESLLKKAIQLDSTYPGYYNNLAILYKINGHYKEAVEQYEKAIQFDSTYLDAYYNLGEFYYGTWQFNKAEQFYKKVLQLNPTDYDTYSNLGLLYTATDRHDLAEEYFKKSIQLDSTSTFWIAYANLGLLYQKLRRWEDLVPVGIKAIDLAPSNIKGYMMAMLGNAYTHIPERLEDAKESLDKGLEMAPDNPDAYLYLAQWALKMDQSDKAWDYLRQAYETGLEKGQLGLKYLKAEPDFVEMRKDPKWDNLMKKYLPKEE